MDVATAPALQILWQRKVVPERLLLGLLCLHPSGSSDLRAPQDNKVQHISVPELPPILEIPWLTHHPLIHLQKQEICFPAAFCVQRLVNAVPALGSCEVQAGVMAHAGEASKLHQIFPQNTRRYVRSRPFVTVLPPT